MMVLEVRRGDNRDQNHRRIWHLRPHITAVTKAFHQCIDQHESRYNPVDVPGFLLVSDLVSAPVIVTEGSMAVN
jgi:hypothetical protein